jgi:hypothetical protein
MLFGCYRRGDANDPDTYVAAIAAVLSRYDADLIREVTDPNTGISTSEKFMTFMPNAGELKVYCDGVAARRERIKHLGSLPAPTRARAALPPPEPRPGDKANVFVPANHHRYADIAAMAQRENERLWRFGKSDDGRAGIWVASHLLEKQRPVSMPSFGDLAGRIVSEAAE